MEQAGAGFGSDEGVWADGMWALAGDAGLDDADEMDFVCPVMVRVSADRLHLQMQLQSDALHAPVEMLTALVREQSADLGTPLTMTDTELAALFLGCAEGEWATVASGVAPEPPVDGGIDVIVPLSTAPDSGWGGRGRCAVRAHAPLARLRTGVAGRPGRDVCGREIAVRPPRAARLPRGENTYLSADGATLLAACDGEVVLRNLHLHVAPMLVLDGETVTADCPLALEGDVFVRGSVGSQCSVTAAGNIHVGGDVAAAALCSTAGRVSVSGSVVGEAGAPARVEVATEIACGSVLHAALRAAGDVRLYEARYSTIESGTLHLRRTIEDSLHDVTLALGGGIVAAPPAPPATPAPTIRQHFRVPTDLAAEIAIGAELPFRFMRCTVEDISVGGVRCALLPTAGASATPGTRVQVKFALPRGRDQVIVVGRVARSAGRHVVGIAFDDLSARDRGRISEYCLELAQVHPDAQLGTPDDRAA